MTPYNTSWQYLEIVWSKRFRLWNMSTCFSKWYIALWEQINVFQTQRFIFQSTDYGRPVRKLPSLHGRKSTPTPKFSGTAEAYFVCHIGPNFQIYLIYTFIGCPTSVVRVSMLPSACKRQIQKKSPWSNLSHERLTKVAFLIKNWHIIKFKSRKNTLEI